MITFVSAFFLCDNRNTVNYASHFDTLANSGIPIILFFDNRLEREFPYENVTVIRTEPPFEKWIKEPLILPQFRTEEKDTSQYLQVQLLKLKFMKDALAYTTSPYLAWIDFRIFHIIHDIELAYSRLQSLKHRSFCRKKIIAAANPLYFSDGLWDKPCWKYCGGFFLGYRDLFEDAFDIQMELVTANLPKLTWEINYWYMLPQLFQGFPSGHNDSIFDIPQFLDIYEDEKTSDS